jgi:hypothetical protein
MLSDAIPCSSARATAADHAQLGTYSHVMSEMARHAADLMGSASC